MGNLFQFEQDKYYPLRRVPMAIRFKLDLCGIKLTIRDWSQFSREDREKILDMACDTPGQIAEVRDRLKGLIVSCKGDSTETAPVDGQPAWTIVNAIPDAVCKQIEALQIPAPTLAQWAALSDLQRFALIKLTREGHENKKLPLALKEFGLG